MFQNEIFQIQCSRGTMAPGCGDSGYDDPGYNALWKHFKKFWILDFENLKIENRKLKIENWNLKSETWNSKFNFRVNLVFDLSMLSECIIRGYLTLKQLKNETNWQNWRIENQNLKRFWWSLITADEGCDSDKNIFTKFFSNFDFQFFNFVNLSRFLIVSGWDTPG